MAASSNLVGTRMESRHPHSMHPAVLCCAVCLLLLAVQWVLLCKDTAGATAADRAAALQQLLSNAACSAAAPAASAQLAGWSSGWLQAEGDLVRQLRHTHMSSQPPAEHSQQQQQQHGLQPQAARAAVARLVQKGSGDGEVLALLGQMQAYTQGAHG